MRGGEPLKGFGEETTKRVRALSGTLRERRMVLTEGSAEGDTEVTQRVPGQGAHGYKVQLARALYHSTDFSWEKFM